jgi:hypothetical protein
VSERLTISFADAEARIQGVAIAGVATLLRLGERLTLTAPPLFAQGGEAWQVSSPDCFELTLETWGRGAPLRGGTQLWACGATGAVGTQRIDGIATLRRSDTPAAGDLALERSLAILFDAQLAFALDARRPRAAGGHGEEQLQAVVFRGEPLEPFAIEKPRLSSSYDADGGLTHAGLELWESEDADRPLRIGGETLARARLAHADGASTDVAFVAWHHDGRQGLGSYSITTPA